MRTYRKLHLFRTNHANLEEVAVFMQIEISGNGQSQGYGWLHLSAIQRRYVVPRNIIRQLMKLFDLEGVEVKWVRCLRRGRYHNKGPNALRYMDLNDKLKLYDIAISGCIDGFSRYTVWMNAYRRNNDSKVIANYLSHPLCAWNDAESDCRNPLRRKTSFFSTCPFSVPLLVGSPSGILPSPQYGFSIASACHIDQQIFIIDDVKMLIIPVMFLFYTHLWCV